MLVAIPSNAFHAIFTGVAAFPSFSFGLDGEAQVCVCVSFARHGFGLCRVFGHLATWLAAKVQVCTWHCVCVLYVCMYVYVCMCVICVIRIHFLVSLRMGASPLPCWAPVLRGD